MLFAGIIGCAYLCPVYVTKPGEVFKVIDSDILFWLAKAAEKARRDAKKGRLSVAQELQTLLGKEIDAQRIGRFERLEVWPEDLDAILNAYARVSGRKDWSSIVRLALDLKEGLLPLEEDGPAPSTTPASTAENESEIPNGRATSEGAN